MSELSTRARLHLDALAREHQAPADRKASGWAQLSERLERDAAAKSRARSRGAWLAFAAAVVLIGASAIVWVGSVQRAEPDGSASPGAAVYESEVEQPAGRAEPRAPSKGTFVTPRQRLWTSEPDPQPEPSPTGVRKKRPAAGSQPPATLIEELGLLDAAERALRDQDPDRALRLLRDHTEQFPSGALVRERQKLMREVKRVQSQIGGDG